MVTLNGSRKSVSALETQGGNMFMYHAAERKDVASILSEGLRAPAYMMNGRTTVGIEERLARKQREKYGTYQGGYQVLLKITLPKDWPLLRDEAADSLLFVKSMIPIPQQYITVDNGRWP